MYLLIHAMRISAIGAQENKICAYISYKCADRDHHHRTIVILLYSGSISVY